jgi:hypothetical protein
VAVERGESGGEVENRIRKRWAKDSPCKTRRERLVHPLTNKRRSLELESENMYPEMHAYGLDLPQHVALLS